MIDYAVSMHASKDHRSRKERSAERRVELLSVGKRVFASRPYDAVSTEDLASEAGISVGLLYHYFGDKRGFYVATLRTAADELLAVVDFRGASLIEGAASLFERFMDFVERHPAMFRGILRGGVGADAEVYAIAAAVRQTVIERVLRAAGRAGARSPEEQLAMHAWLGSVEAAALFFIDGGASRDAVIQLLTSTLPPFLFAELA